MGQSDGIRLAIYEFLGEHDIVARVDKVDRLVDRIDRSSEVLLTPKELAEELGVSVSKIRAMAKDGLPYALTLNPNSPKPRHRYKLSQVKKYLQEISA